MADDFNISVSAGDSVSITTSYQISPMKMFHVFEAAAGAGGGGGAMSGATLRVARLDPQKQTFLGYPFYIQEGFRRGVVKVTPDPELRLQMSASTYSALNAERLTGGATPLLDMLEQEVIDAGADMQTRMVDLGKGPKKVVDRRTVTRPSDDRVEYVVQGISDLTSQMATLLAQPQHVRSEGTVNGAAKRYAELAEEMKKLRRAMMQAEGAFEVAQAQVIVLMDGDS